MARNDGIDRTLARNQDLETPDDVTKVQEHNEREKDRYSNVDIVPERTALNVHFKSPTDDYVKMFEQMEQDKIISTRGLKPDAVKYGELVFDVNSAYFYNHGGYEFAKQFYADAYKAAVEIVGGEQYILSAVMHADERNRAMSEALGEDVYHYHLHVVYHWFSGRCSSDFHQPLSDILYPHTQSDHRCFRPRTTFEMTPSGSDNRMQTGQWVSEARILPDHLLRCRKRTFENLLSLQQRFPLCFSAKGS